MFIRANAYFCKLRKSTRLGQYPILEVVAMGFITALISYPNPYTREDNSALIARLFHDCGPADVSELWYVLAAGRPMAINTLSGSRCGNLFIRFLILLCSDYNRTYTSVTAAFSKAEPGPGVIRGMWQLFLAFIVKFVLSIMSIGMKVTWYWRTLGCAFEERCIFLLL